MKDNGKKRRRHRFKAPAAWLYYPAVAIIGIFMRIRYRVRLDKKAFSDLHGPALLLCNHLSNFDHFLVAMAAYPHRVTFVLSAHFMTKRILRPILRLMHVITKRMFDSDAGTVLNMMRAARDGRILALFPEGRLTWTPHSMRITSGTADLIAKLKVDVYRVTPTGAALTFPKWGRGSRRGRITVETEKILSAADIPSMTKDEIFALISDELRHDDEAACRGVKFACRDTTAGLDGILYKCPVCGAEYALETRASHIKCAACGLDASLSRDYVITGAPFASVYEWYMWQYRALDITRTLTGRFRVGGIGEDGYESRDLGEAVCTLDADTFTFDGTFRGEPLSFTVATSEITALPISVADHFDIYRDKTLFHLYPLPDPRVTVEWAMFVDRLTDLRLGEVGK